MAQDPRQVCRSGEGSDLRGASPSLGGPLTNSGRSTGQSPRNANISKHQVVDSRHRTIGRAPDSKLSVAHQSEKKIGPPFRPIGIERTGFRESIRKIRSRFRKPVLDLVAGDADEPLRTSERDQ